MILITFLTDIFCIWWFVLGHLYEDGHQRFVLTANLHDFIVWRIYSIWATIWGILICMNLSSFKKTTVMSTCDKPSAWNLLKQSRHKCFCFRLFTFVHLYVKNSYRTICILAGTFAINYKYIWNIDKLWA